MTTHEILEKYDAACEHTEQQGFICLVCAYKAIEEGRTISDIPARDHPIADAETWRLAYVEAEKKIAEIERKHDEAVQRLEQYKRAVAENLHCKMEEIVKRPCPHIGQRDRCIAELEAALHRHEDVEKALDDCFDECPLCEFETGHGVECPRAALSAAPAQPTLPPPHPTDCATPEMEAERAAVFDAAVRMMNAPAHPATATKHRACLMHGTMKEPNPLCSDCAGQAFVKAAPPSPAATKECPACGGTDPDPCVHSECRHVDAAASETTEAKVEALRYIDGWIDNKRAVYPAMLPAAVGILDDMRVHIRAAIERLERGERMESTTSLARVISTTHSVDAVEKTATLWKMYAAVKRSFVVPDIDGRYESTVDPGSQVRIKAAMRAVIDATREGQ